MGDPLAIIGIFMLGASAGAVLATVRYRNASAMWLDNRRQDAGQTMEPVQNLHYSEQFRLEGRVDRPADPNCRCGTLMRWAMITDMLSWRFCPVRKWWNFWRHTAPQYSSEDL